jgi:hypothetical protein
MKTGAMVFAYGELERRGIVLGIEKPENVIAFADRVHAALMKGVHEDKKVPAGVHHLNNLLEQ